MATGALSAKTSLAGENSLSAAGTIEFGVGGSYTANSYGTVSTAGNNMYFTNSSGNVVTLTFTNASNYITSSGGGGRTLVNSSSDLNLDFDGNIEIGSTATNTTTFRGAGSFNVDGNLLDTGVNGVRTLQKDGEGTLTLRGSGNNYRGSTLVLGGTLEVAESGVLPVTNSITVSSGATLKFNKPSGGISVGAMTVAGTLEQKLVTISSSGNVNLGGGTLNVTGDTSSNEIEYILISVTGGNSVSGTLSASSVPPGYDLRIDSTSVKLVKTVVVTGSTFDTIYPPGSEEVVGPNGLKNLMNYALGGTGPSSSPALPVLTSDGTEITLTANIRNNDSSLNMPGKVVGQWARSLEGTWTDLPLTDVLGATSGVDNTTVKSITVPIEAGEPRKFLRIKVSK
jgi:autotransporter-associated beta strand protein